MEGSPKRTKPRSTEPSSGLLGSLAGRRNGSRSGSRSRLAGRTVSLLALGSLAAAGVHAWEPDRERERLGVEEAPVPLAELPVEVNARVQKWMHRFSTDQKELFERLLTRRGIYSGLIRSKLREREMPEDLLYLAMIESEFRPRATSRVSATGLWQFMGPTARAYGLRVDRWVDERRDPVQATDAALDYLQWLHGRYDSWYLAAAAYNAGPGRVDRVLRQHAGGRKGDEALYWEIIEHLPRETREYVPRLLAATALARRADRFGFRVDTVGSYRFERVWVPGGTSLAEVADAIDEPATLVHDLNPHLVGGVTPPGESFPLRVPVGSTRQVVASLGRGGGRRFVDGG